MCDGRIAWPKEALGCQWRADRTGQSGRDVGASSSIHGSSGAARGGSPGDGVSDVCAVSGLELRRTAVIPGPPVAEIRRLHRAEAMGVKAITHPLQVWLATRCGRRCDPDVAPHCVGRFTLPSLAHHVRSRQDGPDPRVGGVGRVETGLAATRPPSTSWPNSSPQPPTDLPALQRKPRPRARTVAVAGERSVQTPSPCTWRARDFGRHRAAPRRRCPTPM